jgi:alpha-2-macroglobulin
VVVQRPSLAGAARRLLDESWRAVSVAGTRVEIADSLRGYAPFPSHVRPAARLLTTTLHLRPDHPLIGALAETIIQQGNAERGWSWNTQDYSAAVVSLAELVGRQRASANGDIVMRASDGRVLIARRRGAGETDSTRALTGLLTTTPSGAVLTVSMRSDAAAANVPIFYSIAVTEVAQRRPVTPDIGGIVVERWYERFDDGKPTVEAREGELVRVRLRVTVPADRQFVAVEDMLPAGLEPVDLSLRTSGTLGPFKTATNQERSDGQPGPIWQSLLYGSWDSGWWSPWEYKELRDDRVIYFARQLWTGTYSATYVARATTSGTFVRPPAHAEEMYNPAVHGRSDGGVFVIRR